MFTDWYGQQSCTAGRAAFITGQSPIRTGLTKVGLPGADLGLQPEDPTIADLLKPLGYVTGQFGKNHLGDRDEFLPTAHGFDEFFGNLYHLNAEEEPENPDYPKDPEFKKKFGPRGVLHTWANPDGTQKIENTGPLTRKRMETVDEEFLDASLKFIEQGHTRTTSRSSCWWNSTRMHIFTHLKKESEGKTGLGVYPDGMVEHDGHVGKLLDKLDELGIADNTIVMYSTDNGAEVMSWPDGGIDAVPRREGHQLGGRLARAVRDPLARRDQAGDGVQRDLLAHRHAADAGRGGRRAGRRREAQEGLQGRQQDVQGPHRRLQPAAVPEGRGEGEPAQGLPLLERRRRPDGAARRTTGRSRSWSSAPTGWTSGGSRWCRCACRRSTTCGAIPSSAATRTRSMFYDKWMADRAFLLVPAQAIVGEFLKTFEEFPPRQKPASFSIDQALEKGAPEAGGHGHEWRGRGEVTPRSRRTGAVVALGRRPSSGGQSCWTLATSPGIALPMWTRTPCPSSTPGILSAARRQSGSRARRVAGHESPSRRVSLVLAQQAVPRGSRHPRRGMWNLAGREVRALSARRSRRRHRRQHDEQYRGTVSGDTVRPNESGASALAARTRRRAGTRLRSDRVHRCTSPSCGSRRRGAGASRRPQTGGRALPHGVRTYGRTGVTCSRTTAGDSASERRIERSTISWRHSRHSRRSTHWQRPSRIARCRER